MKNFFLYLFIFNISLTYADFGEVVDCPENLKLIKSLQNTAQCRQGLGFEISYYSQREEKIYIDTGANQLKILNFDLRKAQHCLDFNPNNAIEDVAYNTEIEKWVIYQSQNIFRNIEMVYLLDKDYDLNKFALTFMIEKNNLPLGEIIKFRGTKAIIRTKNNQKPLIVDINIPSIEVLKEKAFNYFEMRSTGWRFMNEGLGDYPAYNQTVAIVNKCENLTNQKKKNNCYHLQGKQLQLNILEYVKKEFQNNDDTRTLMEYLGEDKKKLKELYVAKSIYQAYKELNESQVMNLNYRWDKEGWRISSTFAHFGSAPARQLTYNLSDGKSYFSLGHFAYKPAAFSVRYAYYPISIIEWE